MPVGHLLCLLVGYAVGVVVAAFYLWRIAYTAPPSLMLVTLDPGVTRAIVTAVVRDAMAEMDKDEEPEVFPGDEWKQGSKGGS